MNNQPLVSIIMPCFNSEHFIIESINSVINQSYKNWELIIIDDNSKDRSIEIIQEFLQKENRISLIINEENSGAAISRNKGIEASNGDFIAFLDSDDIWKEEKLEKHIDFMMKNDLLLSYTYYSQISEDGSFIKKVTPPHSLNYQQLLKTCHIGCLTAIYNKKKLGKVYMPNIRKRQDYALWLKILKQNNTAICLPEYLAFYRIRSDSISSNKIKAAKYNWHLYRKIENLNFFKSSYYFVHYAINGIYQKFLKK